MDKKLPDVAALSIEVNNLPPGAPLLSRQEENEYSDKEDNQENISPLNSNSNLRTTENSSTAQTQRELQEDLDSSIKLTPTDSMKNSLISIMAPVVYEMDDRILAVKESQLQLQSLIKRLLEELNSYVDLAHPPKLQDSINKLVGARRRLGTINATLINVQERLDVIYGFMQGNQEP